jgi:hypothetical protein
MYPAPTIPVHVVQHNRGYGFAVAGVSGLLPAGVAAGALLFALYCPQQAAAQASARIGIYLDRLRLAFTTVGAFTAPISAARGLALYRATAGAGHALPTGGTPLTVARKDTGAQAAMAMATAIIANAAALTPGTVLISGGPIAMLDLAGTGAAGQRQEMIYEFAAPANSPLVIGADELLVVSNPIAMDAAGTWQLAVDECHWIEATASAIS